MARSEFISIGSSNKQPFSFEEHKELGRSLKVYANFLSSTSQRVGKSLDDSNAINKNIKAMLAALGKVQQGLHSSMMNDFNHLPDSELLPIYMGRLTDDK
jgi:hypothetical protein